MPKVKKSKSSPKTKRSDDTYLMILAGVAAIIVGFFAVAAYRSKAIALHPITTPAPSITVKLDPQNGSYESGTATLTQDGDKVVVTLDMKGYLNGVSQPAHIHAGKCPNPGVVKYPLTNLLNGKSVTTIDTTLDNLKKMLPLAINVHYSTAKAGLYVSCGDLKF